MSLVQGFTITTRFESGTAVIAVSGELDVFTAPMVRTALSDAMNTGGILRVVVDLTEMEFIDSTGLGVFASATKRLRLTGGRLVLAHPSSSARRVFELTGLDRIVDIEP